MPISATADHSEEHWRDVQTLLHRGIAMAGFAPQNVWESASKDRISERIVGNIFQVPIAVTDISDLNPNVMLELGLRLSSKRPTIVVSQSDGAIPFDIRDFHAIFYPPDMNMLGMEEFFRSLSKALQDKYKAYNTESYTPFLGHVIVDVASPETREVGVTELILSRLDDVMTRMGSLESSVRRPRADVPSRSLKSGAIPVEIPDDNVESFMTEVVAEFEVDGVRKKGSKDGLSMLDVMYSGSNNYTQLNRTVIEMARRYGGDLDIPF